MFVIEHSIIPHLWCSSSIKQKSGRRNQFHFLTNLKGFIVKIMIQWSIAFVSTHCFLLIWWIAYNYVELHNILVFSYSFFDVVYFEGFARLPIHDDAKGWGSLGGCIGKEVELVFWLLLLFFLWYAVAEAVHLPEVPRDDFGKLLQQRCVGLAAVAGLIVVDKRVEQILACQEQAVALPLIAVGSLEGETHLRKPLLVAQLLLADYAELSVEQAHALADGDGLARGGVVA